MMTIASIDTVTEPMTPETSQTMSEVGVSTEAVGAFQQALYRQVVENENLGSVLREAMVSVSTVLAQVEPTVAPTVAAPVSPVVVQPLPMLVTENAALGQTLQSEKVIVENLLPKIEIKIVTKVVEQPAAAPTVTPDPSVVSAPLAAPVVVQPLPVQVTENVKLGETLTAATVVVGETQATVDVAAMGATRSVASADGTEAVPPVVQPLPAQVTENVKLGETLTAATVVVGETLAKVDVAALGGTRPVASADGTETAPPVMVPLPAQVTENVKLGETLAAATVVVGETLAKVDVAALGGTRSVASADGTETVPPVMVPLPVQVTENVNLGETLTAATVVVGETQAKVDVAALGGTRSVASADGTEAVPPVAVPLPAQVTENVKLGETLAAATVVVGETLAKVDVAAMGGARSVASADGTETVPPAVQSSVRDPEASAEALVAAGVTPQAPVQVPAAVEGPQTAPAVAPVDVVRVQAATAAEAVPSQVLVQAAEAVADTLLVSPGLLRGQGEVLVKLRPDVLDGTEVKISVTGRQLDVVFQPQTVDMAVMIENCRTQLVQHLANKIVSFNVTVDVRKKRVES